LLAVGIVMTLIGFAFKIAAAPLHLWAPDAYQSAPIPSAAFMASGSKVASFVVLGKTVLVGFGPSHASADWHGLVAGWWPARNRRRRFAKFRRTDLSLAAHCCLHVDLSLVAGWFATARGIFWEVLSF